MGQKLVRVPLGIERRSQYDFCDDFTAQPQTYQFPLETVTAHADANGDTAATLVGVASNAARLVGGYLVVSANSAGVAASPDDSVWVLSVGGTTYVTLTRATNLVADTPVSLGTPTLTDIAAATAIKLAITNGTNADLNAAVCHVTLTLADAVNFPGPGWTVVATNGGTVAIADGVNGVVALSPGATDNDEIYMARELESMLMTDSEAWMIEARLQWTEANTDDANVAFGVKNAVAADSILDDGAGMALNFSGAAIFKVDGGTVWKFTSSKSTTQTTATSTKTAAGAGTNQVLRIEYRPLSSTLGELVPYVDGVQLVDSTSGLPIKHAVTHTSATEMQCFVACKDGSANRETLYVDLVGGGHLRG